VKIKLENGTPQHQFNHGEPEAGNGRPHQNDDADAETEAGWRFPHIFANIKIDHERDLNTKHTAPGTIA
jgi:hypothetical protein